MSNIVEQLLILPRCGVCRERFPVVIEGRSNPLICEDCERSFQRAMRHACVRCGAPFFSCVCMPAPMRRVGFGALVKLAPYSEEAADRVMRRIVLSLKRKRREALTARCADELCESVLSVLSDAGYDPARAVIVPLPRDARHIARYGVDQANEIAKALFEVTGIPCVGALHRVRHARVQKRLTWRERADNLEGVFAADPLPPDTCVLLVDDVVTTGASMEAAGRALKLAGAKDLLAVVLGYTKKQRNRA